MLGLYEIDILFKFINKDDVSSTLYMKLSEIISYNKLRCYDMIFIYTIYHHHLSNGITVPDLYLNESEHNELENYCAHTILLHNIKLQDIYNGDIHNGIFSINDIVVLQHHGIFTLYDLNTYFKKFINIYSEYTSPLLHYTKHLLFCLLFSHSIYNYCIKQN